MRRIRLHVRAMMVLPMLVPACNETPRSSTVPVAEEKSDAARDMARIDADVRLDVALKRIASLEREVAELKASPATVETDMLRQQLAVTQNALADASRNSGQNEATLAQPVDNSGPRVTPKSSQKRDGRLTQRAITSSPAGAKPVAGPKPRATNRPGLDLDLR